MGEGIRLAGLLALMVLATGCRTLPDSVEYTLGVDHRTGDTTSYFGGSWDLPRSWKK